MIDEEGITEELTPLVMCVFMKWRYKEMEGSCPSLGTNQETGIDCLWECTPDVIPSTQVRPIHIDKAIDEGDTVLGTSKIGYKRINEEDNSAWE